MLDSFAAEKLFMSRSFELVVVMLTVPLLQLLRPDCYSNRIEHNIYAKSRDLQAKLFDSNVWQMA